MGGRYFKYQISGILSIKYQVWVAGILSIKYQELSTKHQVSINKYQVSRIKHQVSSTNCWQEKTKKERDMKWIDILCNSDAKYHSTLLK